MWSTSAGSGIPVVLIPGGFSDYRYWELQQISYAHYYRTIAVSLSGYYPDQSSIHDAMSAERHIEETGEFLATLREPVHLVGHSRGGRIALHVAARFQGHVRSLVLAEPGGSLAPDFLPPADKPDAGIAGADIRREVQDLIARNAPEEGLRRYLDSGHGPGAWERSPEIFRRIAPANAGTIGGMNTDTSGAMSRAVASRIRTPTLLIGGSNSPPLFGQILNVLQNAIATAERVTVDGADHFVNFTGRQEFDRAVLEFFARC